MSEIFKAAGFKLRKTSKAEEKLEQQEKANQGMSDIIQAGIITRVWNYDFFVNLDIF